MLRYLLPSGAIVTICVAIFGTAFKAPPAEDQLIVVPVVLKTPLALETPPAPAGPVPPVA